jgi:molecular chaperone GrpE
MINEDKKYPKIVIGSFIFNENGELFLRQSSSQENNYTCINEKILLGEDIDEVIKKSVKEKTNLDVTKIEFIDVTNGNRRDLGKDEDGTNKHLIFLDYKVTVNDSKKIKSKDERKFEWLTPQKWIEEKDQLAPYILGVMKKLNVTKDSYESMYKRALADYQNLLKQTAKEKMEFAAFANELMLKEILPVYDHLKMAIDHHATPAALRELGGQDGENSDHWLTGVKHVVKQFKDILEKIGVQEIKTDGEKFDHNTMDAIKNEETEDEKQDGRVAMQIKAGYTLNGKVIEAAKVVVYKVINDK